MKKSFDPAPHIPVGKRWENQKTGILWGFALVIATTFSVLANYLGARQSLYQFNPQTRVWTLVESRTIAPYLTLISDTAFLGFGVFLIAMGVLVVRNYQYHRQETMSIYLMKRLPDKWELHRRCWTVPVAAAIIAAALVAVMMGIYYIIYLTCTPAMCLPV